MNNKPYHHLPDGTFRNPEGSPVRSNDVKFSYRTFIKEKKKIDIHDEVVNLELKRKYQVDITTIKEEHKERVDNLKKMTSDNIQKDLIFSELIKYLDVKVEQKELQEHIQKYYGEKVDQRAAETAYGTLLRNKIADHSMKTFKIKETKLSLDEMMKKGSHNHEPGSHSH